MKDLNAQRFFDLVGSIRETKTFIDNRFDDNGRREPLIPDARNYIEGKFYELRAASEFVGAELSNMAATRMHARLQDQTQIVTLLDARNAIHDVESRLLDEIGQMSFMVLSKAQRALFSPANDLAEWDIVRIFPDAARELEEAAKCLALQRPTASVFHAMRMLEVGIAKLAELLEVPPPEKPAQRNWGLLLSSISEKLKEKFSAKDRMDVHSLASKYDQIYASLDAVKNPWRNNTMHVEGFYPDAEALHVLRCVTVFMQKLAAICEPNEPLPDDDSTLPLPQGH